MDLHTYVWNQLRKIFVMRDFSCADFSEILHIFATNHNLQVLVGNLYNFLDFKFF